MTRKIDISHKTVFFIAGFLFFLWALFLVKDLILLLFVSVIFVSAISPLVDRLAKWRIPKPLGIAIVYILVFALLGLILTIGLTPITIQTSSLLQRLQDSLAIVSANFHLDQATLSSQIPDVSKNILSVTLDAFKALITSVLVAVITFYLLLDKDKLETKFAGLFGEREERIKKLLYKIEVKLGGWLHGQILLSVIVAVLIYIGLTVLGVDFALPLAIICGLFEVVPLVGPILSAVPAIAIALITSPLLALFVGILYLVVQQLESHVIVPQVMKRAVGLNPLLVIITISIGSRLLGVAGALLAVPITVVGQIIVEEYLSDNI